MNPLSRTRLEATLAKLGTLEKASDAERGWSCVEDECDWQTIQAALQFLLEPQVTDDMRRAFSEADCGSGTTGWLKAMIAARTAEDGK